MDEQLPPVGILNLSQSDLVCYFQAIFDVLTVREGLKKYRKKSGLLPKPLMCETNFKFGPISKCCFFVPKTGTKKAIIYNVINVLGALQTKCKTCFKLEFGKRSDFVFYFLFRWASPSLESSL